MINRRAILAGAALSPIAGGAVASDTEAPEGLYMLPPEYWNVSVEDGCVLVGAMVRKSSKSQYGSIHWVAFDSKNQQKYRDTDGNYVTFKGDKRYPRIDDWDKEVVGAVVYNENGANYIAYATT